MSPTKRPKPRRWCKRTDPPCCLACEKPFTSKDKAYAIGVCMIHEGCVKLYLDQCKELGLRP